MENVCVCKCVVTAYRYLPSRCSRSWQPASTEFRSPHPTPASSPHDRPSEIQSHADTHLSWHTHITRITQLSLSSSRLKTHNSCQWIHSRHSSTKISIKFHNNVTKPAATKTLLQLQNPANNSQSVFWNFSPTSKIIVFHDLSEFHSTLYYQCSTSPCLYYFVDWKLPTHVK